VPEWGVHGLLTAGEAAGFRPLLTHQVVSYLLGRGLLCAAEVVDGEARVVEASRRNRNYVVRSGGRRYFLKQAADLAGAGSIERERCFYEYAARSPAMVGVRPGIGELVVADRDRALLVLALVPGGVDLRAKCDQLGAFPRHPLARLGRTQAALHHATYVGMGAPGEDLRLFQAPPPWALFLDAPTTETLRLMSGAAVEYIRILQATPSLRASLGQLRESWDPSCLIHQDIKWDNCVVHPREGSSRTSRLCLVDWEFAVLGEPAWDVGSVLSEFLASWLASVPVAVDDEVDRYLDLAEHPLDKMRPQVHAFWSSYVTARGLSGNERRRLLVRSVELAAVRLLQTAFEQLQVVPRITSHAVCLLQLAQNLLLAPEIGAAQLLGLYVDPQPDQVSVRASREPPDTDGN